MPAVLHHSQDVSTETIVCRDFRAVPKSDIHVNGCSSGCKICYETYKAQSQTPADFSSENTLVQHYKDKCSHIRKVQTSDKKQKILQEVAKFKLEKQAKSELLYRNDCEAEGYTIGRQLGQGSCSMVLAATVSSVKYLKSKRIQLFLSQQQAKEVISIGLARMRHSSLTLVTSADHVIIFAKIYEDMPLKIVYRTKSIHIKNMHGSFCEGYIIICLQPSGGRKNRIKGIMRQRSLSENQRTRDKGSSQNSGTSQRGMCDEHDVIHRDIPTR